MSEKMEQANNIVIEQQKNIYVTGVTSVNVFTPTSITLSVAGKKLTVTGNNLKITEFSKENEKFSASGEIVGVKYGNNTVGLKFFK